MLLVCHKSIQKIKAIDYIEGAEISLCIDRPCLSETPESPICYSFYVINIDTLLQIPKTNCDEKFTREKLKYAPVIYTERRKMTFWFCSSACSAFRALFSLVKPYS